MIEYPANKSSEQIDNLKTCNVCNVLKVISEFELHRKTCKACRKKRRDARCKEYMSENTNDKCPPDHECVTCHKTVEDGAVFGKRKDILTGGFKSQCKTCFNAKKYYVSWRERKKVECSEKFLSHNAAIMRQWREKNSDKWKKYCMEFAKRPKSIVNRICKSAKLRKISFSDEDRDFFESIITQTCNYCGCDSSGLDRVDSSLGYFKGNVVPCCVMCNLMKLNYNVDCFHDKIRKIVNFHQDAISGLDERVINWGSNFQKKKETPRTLNRKEILCSKEYLDELKMQKCYLCNCDGGGVDRLNSELPYSEKNCRPCCKMCNYMKKDYTLEAFLYKCNQIFSMNENRRKIASQNVIEQ